MKAERDPKTGRWLIQYRYTDWQGKRRKSTKRGFSTKREAEDWLRKFLTTSQMDLSMKFTDFLDLYYKDMENRLREYTIRTKKYIIDQKIIPFFGEKAMNEITAPDIRKWQNILMQQGYSETYLRTINNQLAAIFNYAVKYYDLKQEAQQYQQIKDQQLAKNEALKKEKELLSDTSYIESVARETLGLVKKGEVLVVPAKEDAQVGQSKVDANKDIH